MKMKYYRYDYLENELKITAGKITKEETLSRITRLAVLAEQINKDMEEAKKAVAAEGANLVVANLFLNGLANKLCDAGRDVSMITET